MAMEIYYDDAGNGDADLVMVMLVFCVGEKSNVSDDGLNVMMIRMELPMTVCGD